MIARILWLWRLASTVMAMADRANLGLIAAGVAFFGMFAIFPALAAIIAVFGLVADPGIVESQLDLMRDVIPTEAFYLIDAQISRLLSARTETLGWATALSTGVALWSSRAGVAALMRGLNAIKAEPNRGGLRHYAVALLLTICLVGIAVVALLVVVVAPVVLAFLPLGGVAALALGAVRWGVALFIILAGLGILYRFGPNTPDARTGWVSPGALTVMVVWIVASAGFSAYLKNFGSYNEVYGSIGAVIAMLMWLYITAYLVLLGAVLNVVLRNRRASV